MATRRIVTTEKTSLDRDEVFSASAGSTTQKSNIAPAVPTHVILKLLAATLAMIVLPIGSYFATLHTFFNGNASYAGGFAAVMANVVLIGYVIVAMNEDESERRQEGGGGKDSIKSLASEAKKDR
ncbi:uncharacterized protein B0I36DRAFT_327177 [Microdochium trichocladiopsis]|uniref:Vacuolar ATPase assembly integral membrane protein VMA21 n=1 Tax=Microdochium trichocladiopsis TaxID=1682393 RepID=A0A9P8Y1I9_9PEZI|nr:uncharacterized protein B0I36DRAFT_327177 [Microdochium trichocladiopsis]KAH7027480.1 hypothetical protein B0I36DRAFT_327177 [Microdochium trichocladiopsis]